MDLSSEQSRDEARIMERQLYRAGQAPPPPKPAAARPAGGVPPKKLSTASKGDPIPMMQRRLVRVALGATWLLALTGVSYCVFLPDPVDEAKKARDEIFRDNSLTWEQKREKSNAVVESLTPRQRYNLLSPAEFRVKMHDDLDAFFKLSPAEQKEQLKKEILEREKRREEWRAKMAANGGPGGQGGGPKGQGGFVRGGPPGGGGGPPGGFVRGGPPGGGRGGNSSFNREDAMPPETMEQMGLKMGMMRDMQKEMGLGGRGGRGGPGGGRGGRGGPPQ
jgi:hypothetical protein